MMTLRSSKLWKIFIGSRGKNLWSFSFVVLAGCIAALFESVSFGFLFAAFSGLQGADKSPSGGVLTSFFLGHLNGTKLFFASTIYAILFQVARSGVCYLATVFSSRFAFKIQTQIQSEAYAQILRFSYGYITRLKIGDLLERARSPVNFVNPMLEGVTRLIVSLLTVLVIAGMMFWLDYRLTILVLCLFGFFVFLQKSIIKTILNNSDSLSRHSMEINQETSQALQGIKVIQTFCQEKKIKQKINDQIKRIGKLCEKVYVLSNIVPYLNEMISVVVLGIVLIAATFLIGLESSSFLATLMTFLILSYRLSTRVQNAIGVLGTTSIYYGCLLRVHEILEDTEKEFVPVGGIECSKPVQSIEVKKLSFFHYKTKDPVLSDISFSVSKGDMVGIVGLSGSGKTSLLDLLLRLYEPSSGKILANNTDIQSFLIESWRSKFGVVGQESFLFDDTIWNNIAFGAENTSEMEIIQAAKDAGIHELIQQLPLQYQTAVGERGLRLSGGERQRVVLARALLRDPEILILDEATSSLDSQSEFYIQRALEKIRHAKTLLVIAHRLSTIIRADLILVVERGTLIESGTHEELLRKGGRYAMLWDLQTKKQDKFSELIGV